MNLSKSRYTSGIRCEKLLWLDSYHNELADDMGNNSVLENGNEVGDLARGLFGKYKLIDFSKGFSSMIQDTKKLLDEKENVICEASFYYDGNFCSVDILKNDLDGVEIYEVKSSTDIKDIYIDDISYQVWVLKNCGLNVKKAYIVYVNSQYIKNGELDIYSYFNIKDVTNDILDDNVLSNVIKFRNILDNKNEPSNDLSKSCHSPYDCPYFHYCTRNLPSPNVFDVGCSVRFSSKLEKYYNNIVTYQDLLDTGGFNDRACEQMLFELNNLPPKINKDKIISFLEQITYPVYFLDFESYQASIPTIDGTKPYQQICFQYSLHYYLEDGGELFHKEFLSDDYDGNPMYGLCEKLCQDIPKDSCVLVYNDSFEKTRLQEMANLFPEFRDHLLNIKDNIIDLFPIFKKHDYYVKEMGGSASIKKVLPALFPNEASLDYHNLDQVHKGDEASSAFLSLKNLDDDKREELRCNMLKYCQLDTFAMVKIYDKLKEIIMNLDDFLIEAKKQTYANENIKKQLSTRKGSFDYEYSSNGMTYHDTFFGGVRFMGEEVVYKDDDTPIWGMNYYGVTLDMSLSEEAIDKALRPALMMVGEDKDILPVRGPREYVNGEYKYCFIVNGDLEYFDGKECIFKEDKKIYELKCHGGMIK